MKDKSIQKAKILEVTIDKVKFKKFEIITGPSYEILKSEVVKIRYSNGFTDIFDKGSLLDTIENKLEKNKHDTVNYSMVYIVNTYDQGAKLSFPVYLNGRYIFTISNHDKGTVKIYSEGQLALERQPKDGSSPRLNLMIEHGKCFGVSIEHPYPNNLIRNKRFSIRKVSDSAEFKKFMELEFNGRKSTTNPFQTFEEDINNPIISR